jgi:hypothetical protein
MRFGDLSMAVSDGAVYERSTSNVQLSREAGCRHHGVAFREWLLSFPAKHPSRHPTL